MLRPIRAALLSAALLLPALPACAQVGHAQTPIAQPPTEDLSMEVMKSFGCLATGTGGTLAAIGFGPENLVNLVSGGIVTPANSAVLAIGVVGVVFASFCTVGESLTPSVLYMTDRAAPVATRIADATIAALESTAAAARATGTTLAGALSPTIDATLAAADTALAAAATTSQRFTAAALATAAEAIDTARTATLSPTAWAESGWNALAELCLQSPLCHTRVLQAPTPPRNVAER